MIHHQIRAETIGIIGLQRAADSLSNQRIRDTIDWNAYLPIGHCDLSATASHRNDRENRTKRNVSLFLCYVFRHACNVTTKLTVMFHRSRERKKMLWRTESNTIASENIVKVFDVIAETRGDPLRVRKKIHGLMLDACLSQTVTCP